MHQRTTSRSSNGCWTCRLRRKKCDETRPLCQECSFLQTDCTYSEDKPEWMDAGPKQAAMLQYIKRQIKERAPYRIRGERAHLSVNAPDAQASDATSDARQAVSTGTSSNMDVDPISASTVCQQVRQTRPFRQSDSVLVTFYLDHVLPFFFPLYQPTIGQGGQAWILDLIVSSPVFRQTVLCQSSYFFSHEQGVAEEDHIWSDMLIQTHDIFEVLHRAIQVLQDGGFAEHMHGAARIMAAILQLQRFEITTMCYDNCSAHLDAAIAILTQLFDSVPKNVEHEEWLMLTPFQKVRLCLGPALSISHGQKGEIPSSEQAAFDFACGLLLFDDVIASTTLHTRPRLSEYHTSSLCHLLVKGPIVELSAITGCSNSTLRQIAVYARYAAEKKGSQQIIEPPDYRTTCFSLESELETIEGKHLAAREVQAIPVTLFPTMSQREPAYSNSVQQARVGSIWIRAAQIYASLVMYGWHPANTDIRKYVTHAVMLMERLHPPTLLRTVSWPFCMIGCHVEPKDQHRFRQMVYDLKPATLFGPLRSALKVMESVWSDLARGNDRDLSAYFKEQGGLVLLV